MHQQQPGRLRRPMFRAAAVTGCGTLVSALCMIGVTSPAMGSAGRPVRSRPGSGCPARSSGRSATRPGPCCGERLAVRPGREGPA